MVWSKRSEQSRGLPPASLTIPLTLASPRLLPAPDDCVVAEPSSTAFDRPPPPHPSAPIETTPTTPTNHASTLIVGPPKARVGANVVPQSPAQGGADRYWRCTKPPPAFLERNLRPGDP